VSATEASARGGELSPPRLNILNATRLRNTFMPREGEEMFLARPERSLRGKAPIFSFARYFQQCTPLRHEHPQRSLR
jgi:hypothetical protein